MDWKQFAASVIESLAWPLVVLVLALFLRKSLVELVVRLRKIKHKDTELEFEQQVLKIESALPPPKHELKPISESMEDLVRASPRAAVMESWVMVEGLLYKKAEAIGAVDSSRRRPAFSRAIEAIWKRGVIDPSTMRAILEMRDLRNRIAHDESLEVGASDARRFAVLASTLSERLQ